ncbi:hypothetical protein JIN85_07060 [Luteolibacter pohnpeiensis]|uniref:Uncharacterized protein n=1 Tax=Luteolibacter pohnpeiensis TaxID=454153 RepID=A0A934S7E2_9BACT|nr:hypothetical protein [Luteolibacter pohnpeiensis]MBK1882166.1 hypothetical protein [Luteolibacter pohnpeiensis]
MKLTNPRLYRMATGFPYSSLDESTGIEAISGRWVFAPLGPLSDYESPTKNGWGIGSNDYSAVGLDLSWIQASEVNPIAPSDYYTYRINNYKDLTAFDEDYYISLKFDPRAALRSLDYVIASLSSAKRQAVDLPGCNFEIRTSFDQFESPMVKCRGGEAFGMISSGAVSRTNFYHFESLFTGNLSAPLEVRFYYYGENLSPTPALAMCGPDLQRSPFSLRFLAVTGDGTASPSSRFAVQAVDLPNSQRHGLRK